MPTYDSMQFARSCSPRSQFNRHFLGGEAVLVSGDTMPVDFVTDTEIRTFQIREVFCPAEHRWLTASKIKLQEEML